MGGTQGNENPGRHGFFYPRSRMVYFTFLAHRFYRIFSTKITFWAPKKLSNLRIFIRWCDETHQTSSNKKNQRHNVRDLQLQPRSSQVQRVPPHKTHLKKPGCRWLTQTHTEFFLQQKLLCHGVTAVYLYPVDILYPPQTKKKMPQISLHEFSP